MGEDLLQDPREVGGYEKHLFRTGVYHETRVDSLLGRLAVGIGREGRSVVKKDRLVTDWRSSFSAGAGPFLERNGPGQVTQGGLNVHHRKIGSVASSHCEVVRGNVVGDDEGKGTGK